MWSMLIRWIQWISPKTEFAARFKTAAGATVVKAMGLLVPALLFVGCASFMQSVLEEPKVSFDSIGIRDANNDGAIVVVGLKVDNPNRIKLQIDEIVYSLELGGRKVSSTKIDKVSAIEPRGVTKVEIPIPFRYDQVFSSILELLAKGSASYKVTGEARVGLFKLPFDQSGELKLKQ